MLDLNLKLEKKKKEKREIVGKYRSLCIIKVYLAICIEPSHNKTTILTLELVLVSGLNYNQLLRGN